jgi:hypothetical protein
MKPLLSHLSKMPKPENHIKMYNETRGLVNKAVSCKSAMNQIQAEKYMREAISEGRKALGKCSPNPPVGCVLVKGQEIISKGHTNEPCLPHAEAMALARRAKRGASGRVKVPAW